MKNPYISILSTRYNKQIELIQTINWDKDELTENSQGLYAALYCGESCSCVEEEGHACCISPNICSDIHSASYYPPMFDRKTNYWHFLTCDVIFLIYDIYLNVFHLNREKKVVLASLEGR